MDATKCGAFIAKLRNEREMTQKDLSEVLNVSDKAISRWETGKGYPSDINQAKKSDPLRDWDITREINGVSKSPVRGNEFENVEKKEFNVFGSNSDFSDGDDDLSVPPFLNHRNNQ